MIRVACFSTFAEENQMLISHSVNLKGGFEKDVCSNRKMR